MVSKKELLEFLLQRTYPWVGVVPDHPGVDVPSHLRGNPRVDFQLRFKEGAQIPDLIIDDAGWSGTLSFNGSLHRVVVPWEACLAFSEGPATGFLVVFPGPPIDEQKPDPERPKLRVVK